MAYDSLKLNGTTCDHSLAEHFFGGLFEQLVQKQTVIIIVPFWTNYKPPLMKNNWKTQCKKIMFYHKLIH